MHEALLLFLACCFAPIVGIFVEMTEDRMENDRLDKFWEFLHGIVSRLPEGTTSEAIGGIVILRLQKPGDTHGYQVASAVRNLQLNELIGLLEIEKMKIIEQLLDGEGEEGEEWER